METWHIVLSFVVMLGMAVALGGLSEWLRQSAIVGFLVAGALAGPGGLNLIQDPEAVEIFAELGVALLLFTIGLEFSLQRLRALGRFALGGGIAQVLATAVVFTLGGLIMGLPLRVAVVLGLLVAPSSTACVLRLLRDRAELDTIYGRNATGILLLQDLALVPLVLLVQAMGSPAEPLKVALEILVAAIVFASFVIVAYALSGRVFSRLYMAAARLRNRDLLMIMAVVVALGATWGAHMLHFSPALGAFVAGLMLAGTPFAMQLRADVAPLRTIFVTLFFVSVGMLSDLRWMATHIVPVALFIAVLILGKALVIIALSAFFRQSVRNAVATGIALAQVGEFSFVLATIARNSGVLGDDLFRLIISATIGSMALTPFMLSLAPRLGEAVQRHWHRLHSRDRVAEDEGGPGEALFDHIIVVGFGPAGRRVVQAALDHGVTAAVIDLNPQGVEDARELGVHAEMADACQHDVLDHLGIGCARALVVTIPDHRGALAVVRQGASIAPETPIYVRSRYAKYGPELMDAGSRVVIDEEECIGQILGERLVDEVLTQS